MHTLLPALSALVFLVPTRAADPKDPDIGFDYRALVRDQMKLVSEGKQKEAVDLLVKNAFPDTFGEPAREELQKKFAALYGTAGQYVGQEVVGFKRIGSRAYRFYAVAYFEKTVVTFTYLSIKTTDAGWKLSTFQVANGFEELEKLTPFIPLGPVRD